MKKIILIGSFSGANYGDTLILFSLIEYLIEKNVKVIVIPSSSPKIIKEILSKQTFQCEIIVENISMRTSFGYRFFSYNVWKHLKSSDAIIFTAGTIFFRNLFDPRINFVFSVFLLYPFIKIFQLQIKGYYVGINENILTFSFVKKIFAKSFLNKFKVIITRDSLSAETLYGIDFKKDKIIKAYDIGFYNLLKKNYKSDKLEGIDKKDNIGLNLCEYLGEQVGKEIDVKDVVSFIERITLDFHNIYWMHTTERDKIFVNQQLIPHLSSSVKNKTIHVDLYNDFSNELFFKHLDLFIGMRMHSIIPAISFKIPVFALNYNDKVKGLLLELNAKDSVSELDELQNLSIESIIENSFLISDNQINLILKTINSVND